MNSQISTCPSCHIAKKWDKLATHERSYCDERLAPWDANQKEKKEEKVKEEQAKTNSWAAKVTKSIPSNVSAKIAEENRILAEQSEKKRAAEAAERKRICENEHSMRMMTKYGLKKDFIMPPHKLKIYPRYEFWYFGIEGTQDDKGSISEVAKKMREDPTNRENFHTYLEEQYFVNWIYETKGTKDDCEYLRELRYKQAWDDECAYNKRLEQERLWEIELEEKLKEVEREKKDMYEWVKTGRISQKVYRDWRISKDQEKLERERELHNEGLRLGLAEMCEKAQMALAEAAWKARKEARGKYL
jgi:hypothetical protein